MQIEIKIIAIKAKNLSDFSAINIAKFDHKLIDSLLIFSKKCLNVTSKSIILN
jgi:hypothetical protein